MIVGEHLVGPGERDRSPDSRALSAYRDYVVARHLLESDFLPRRFVSTRLSAAMVGAFQGVRRRSAFRAAGLHLARSPAQEAEVLSIVCRSSPDRTSRQGLLRRPQGRRPQRAVRRSS